MPLSAAIAANACLGLAVIGALAWFMTRPRRLTPHTQPVREFTAHRLKPAVHEIEAAIFVAAAAATAS
jgi:hypothetical protein